MTVYRKTFASHLKQFRLICFYLTSYTEQFCSQSKKKHIILEEEFLPTNTTNWLGFVYNTSQNDKYFEADFVGHHRQSVPFQKLVLYKFATIDILSFFPNSIWEVFSSDVSLATSPRYNSSSCYILILVQRWKKTS